MAADVVIPERDVDLARFITPADIAVYRRARRRGGEPAAAKVVAAIGRRIGATLEARERLRLLMMRDDGQDHVWPPPFLRGGG
jgi:hypothetical protein